MKRKTTRQARSAGPNHAAIAGKVGVFVGVMQLANRIHTMKHLSQLRPKQTLNVGTSPWPSTDSDAL